MSFEKRLREDRERFRKAKQQFRNRNDVVQMLQWYRISGMIDYINCILGVIELSKDNWVSVKYPRCRKVCKLKKSGIKI